MCVRTFSGSTLVLLWTTRVDNYGRPGNYRKPRWQLRKIVSAITETRVGKYGNPRWQLWKPVLAIMETRNGNYGNPCSVMETLAAVTLERPRIL
eukprot:3334996-Pyramimonas_sp.AAC.1